MTGPARNNSETPVHTFGARAQLSSETAKLEFQGQMPAEVASDPPCRATHSACAPCGALRPATVPRANLKLKPSQDSRHEVRDESLLRATVVAEKRQHRGRLGPGHRKQAAHLRVPGKPGEQHGGGGHGLRDGGAGALQGERLGSVQPRGLLWRRALRQVHPARRGDHRLQNPGQRDHASAHGGRHALRCGQAGDPAAPERQAGGGSRPEARLQGAEGDHEQLCHLRHGHRQAAVAEGQPALLQARVPAGTQRAPPGAAYPEQPVGT